MSPTAMKGLIAAGCLGCTGIGVWQLVDHMMPRTIGQKIAFEGLTLLSFEENKDQEGWKKSLSEYKMNNSDNGKFKDLDINTGTSSSTTSTNNPEEIKKLQQKCREVSAKKLEGDYESDLTKVRRWCTSSISDVTAKVAEQKNK